MKITRDGIDYFLKNEVATSEGKIYEVFETAKSYTMDCYIGHLKILKSGREEHFVGPMGIGAGGFEFWDLEKIEKYEENIATAKEYLESIEKTISAINDSN